jgi:NCS1 family nucleobase:cation symporter-1
LTITLTALIGVVVTSASSNILGALYWNPNELLAAIQEYYHSDSRVRAGVFFAGLGCVCTQLAINVVLNSVSTGMDMAGLFPRYINIRRGAYILAAMGLACNAWQVLSAATTFLTVISGFGIFLAPMTGIMLADYLVVRRTILKVEDLYKGDDTSIYWYFHGVHWRAVVAWVMGTWPTFPGFVMLLNDPLTNNSWANVFKISFLVGLSISFVTFILICFVSPPPHLGEGFTYLVSTIFFFFFFLPRYYD